MEECGGAAYLISYEELSAESERLRAESGWRPADEIDFGDLVLKWFWRPSSESSAQPAGNPDLLGYIVDALEFAAHVASFNRVGWRLVNAPAPELNGPSILFWASPQLESLLPADPFAPGVDPPPDLAPMPPSHYTPSYRSEGEWGATVQSGMRAGAFASFLDGISGGGFLDF